MHELFYIFTLIQPASSTITALFSISSSTSMRLVALLFGLIFCLVLKPEVTAQNIDVASTQEPVTIYLGWSHQFQFAGYYVAKEKGFYSDAGLDVTLNADKFQDPLSKITEIEGGYAVSTAGTLLSHPKIKQLSALAVVFQQSPLALVTLKSSGINSLLELEGKTVVAGAETKAMMSSAGVDLDEVNFIHSSTEFSYLLNGDCDAVTYYITDNSSKLPGKDSLLFNTFRPMEYGIRFYGECLSTSREEVKNNPERVQKVLEATIKGWEYAIENQVEVVDMIYENYYSGFTRQDLLYESEITIHSLILPIFYDVGDMQQSKWQQMADVLFSLGVVSSPLDLKGFVYSPAISAQARVKRILQISALVLAFLGVIMLFLLLYNWQLKRAVRARTKSLEKTNRALDSFVYSVSHDIRSPLSSIQGIINLMRLDPQDMDKYIELVESSINRLEDFTGDILAYSRNSRSDLKLNAVDVTSIIEKSINGIKFLDEKNNITFIKEFKSNGGFTTDAWRLEVILGNLISNAVKYSDLSKESSYVRIRATVDNHGLNIFIEDNGIGIAENHMGKIYDMFYRATESSTGSGLGLYIVSETVEFLQGKIDIKSKLHQGTKITIKLPDLAKKRNPFLKTRLG